LFCSSSDCSLQVVFIKAVIILSKQFFYISQQKYN
jgi:hypothetical protein